MGLHSRKKIKIITFWLELSLEQNISRNVFLFKISITIKYNKRHAIVVFFY
jgi:hypothetical protein